MRDEESELFFRPLIRNHGFRKIPNPFNWDSDVCSFVEIIITYPDVLRVPISLYSLQTLIFIGFTVREAENLWERQQICNKGRSQYTLLTLAHKYLKENAENATSLEQVLEIGFNPSSPNTGFFPGVGYRSGIPALPVIDIDRPAEGSKLIDWCYWITFRRFIFLLYLEPMLQDLVADGPDRHPLELWHMITASFKHPKKAKGCPLFDIDIPTKGNLNSEIADGVYSEIPDQGVSYEEDANMCDEGEDEDEDEDEVLALYGERQGMEIQYQRGGNDDAEERAPKLTM